MDVPADRPRSVHRPTTTSASHRIPPPSRRKHTSTRGTRSDPGTCSRASSVAIRRRSGVAAITRSAGILCGLKRLGARSCGIPDDVPMKLQHLLWMYGTADPERPRVIGVADHPENEEDDDDDDDDDDDYRLEQGDSPRCLSSPPQPGPSGRQTRKTAAPAPKGKRPLSQQLRQSKRRHLPFTPPKSKPELRASSCNRHRGSEDSGERLESRWAYGPKATTHQVSVWFRSAGG